MRDPQTVWRYPALITHSPFWLGVNHAVRSQRYHYIRYSDGGEELYDMSKDPHQWNNVADHFSNFSVKKRLRKWLPKTNAPHFRATVKKQK